MASDLHLEAFLRRDIETLIIDFLPKDDRDAESILLLAGDICASGEHLLGFLKLVEDRFFAVHFIPGNHEYYHSNYDKWNNRMKQLAKLELKTNFVAGQAGEHQYFNEDGSPFVRVISATLWGDGGKTPFEQNCVGWYLNDFRLIWRTDEQYYHDRQFTVPDMINLHREQRGQIEDFLRIPFGGKTVVMTHHMPSYTLCHPRFGADANGGFASDSEDLIQLYHPEIWVHGHTHDTIDTKIADTRIICNPAGYRGEWQTEFNRYAPLFIEI